MTPEPSPQIETLSSLPFPGRTGRGVRLAVIDSGVNPRHPHIAGVAGGTVIGADAQAAGNSYLDFLGHGTAVMAAIQEKAPDAEYYAVKLFHSALRTTTENLFQALEWTIENRMEVVNLSLGTRKVEYEDRFKELIARAAERGVMLVSALEADGQVCMPGYLPGVFGAGLDWDCNRYAYRVEQTPAKTVFYASGYPRPLPGMPRERNLLGISFAVANLTGFIARACEGLADRSHQAIQEALIAEAAAHSGNG